MGALAGSIVGILLSVVAFVVGVMGVWVFLQADNVAILILDMLILSLIGSVPFWVFFNSTVFLVIFIIMVVFTFLVAFNVIKFPPKIKFVSIMQKIPIAGGKIIPVLEKAVPEIKDIGLDTKPLWLLIYPFLIIVILFIAFIAITGWWAILSIFISVALIIVLVVLSVFAGGFPWVQIAEAAPKYAEEEVQKQVEKVQEKVAGPGQEAGAGGAAGMIAGLAGGGQMPPVAAAATAPAPGKTGKAIVGDQSQAQDEAEEEKEAEKRVQQKEDKRDEQVAALESNHANNRARIDSDYQTAVAAAAGDSAKEHAAKKAHEEAIKNLEKEKEKAEKKILGDYTEAEEKEEKEKKKREKIRQGGASGFYAKNKGKVLITVAVLAFLILPSILCTASSNLPVGRAFCTLDDTVTGPLRRGVGSIIDVAWTQIKNFFWGTVKQFIPQSPLMKDLTKQSCYPFCTDPTGSDTKWEGLDITRIEFIPHVIYSHQQFSIVMEFENKGKTPATFTPPEPQTEGLAGSDWLSWLKDLLPDGAVDLLWGDDQKFRGGLMIGCTEHCKLAPGIADWIWGSGKDPDFDPRCDEICPIDAITDSKPYVVGGCANEIVYRDSDQDKCVDDFDDSDGDGLSDFEDDDDDNDCIIDLYDDEPYVYNPPPECKKEEGTQTPCKDSSLEAGEIKRDAGGFPLECTLDPGDILRMTWYGLKVKGGTIMDIGEELEPDATIEIEYTYKPANDLIGTISMMAPETQVAGAEQKSIGRIANKISQSYSPTGPMMMALGTAEEQVVSGSPFFFMVQFTNKGAGTIPKISKNVQMLYMPYNFVLRPDGCDFKLASTSTDWWNPTSKWYPGPNFVNCLDGSTPADGNCGENNFEYKAYVPRENIRELGKNTDPLYNPMYSCVVETPDESALKSYNIKYRVLQYAYQVEDESDIKIIGTQIAPQLKPGDWDCTPLNPCNPGYYCQDGSCFDQKLKEQKDPNNVRFAILDDERGNDNKDNDELELYDVGLSLIKGEIETGRHMADIAVGDFYLDKGGQEVVIIDDDNSGKTDDQDDLWFMSKTGDSLVIDGKDVGYDRLRYIAAGDLVPSLAGDEIVAVNFKKNNNECTLVIFDKQGKFLTGTESGSSYLSCSDVAVGKFKPGSDKEYIALLRFKDSQYHVQFFEVSSTNSLNSISTLIPTGVSRPTEDDSYDRLDNPYNFPDTPVYLTALTAGDFDDEHANDELVLLAHDIPKNTKVLRNKPDVLFFFNIDLLQNKLTLLNSGGSSLSLKDASRHHAWDFDAGDVDATDTGDEFAVLVREFDEDDQKQLVGGKDKIFLYRPEFSAGKVILGTPTVKETGQQDSLRIAVFDLPDTSIRSQIESVGDYNRLYCCGAGIKDPDNADAEPQWYYEWATSCKDAYPWYWNASKCNAAGGQISKMTCEEGGSIYDSDKYLVKTNNIIAGETVYYCSYRADLQSNNLIPADWKTQFEAFLSTVQYKD
ncbi:MAG: MFS transporter [archaeon]